MRGSRRIKASVPFPLARAAQGWGAGPGGRVRVGTSDRHRSQQQQFRPAAHPTPAPTHQEEGGRTARPAYVIMNSNFVTPACAGMTERRGTEQPLTLAISPRERGRKTRAIPDQIKSMAT